MLVDRPAEPHDHAIGHLAMDLEANGADHRAHPFQQFLDRGAADRGFHRNVVIDAVVGEIRAQLVGVHARPRLAELCHQGVWIVRYRGHVVPPVRVVGLHPMLRRLWHFLLM